MLMFFLTLILFIAISNFAFDVWDRKKDEKREAKYETMELLKLVSKHEVFDKFSNEPVNFESWLRNFLKLKDYRDIVLNPTLKDGSQNIIAIDKYGQTVYIQCALLDPNNWDKNVGQLELQNLLGKMVADGVKRGLVITTSGFTSEAKEYILKVNGHGYKVELVDGNSLMSQLYDLREVRLKEMIALG